MEDAALTASSESSESSESKETEEAEKPTIENRAEKLRDAKKSKEGVRNVAEWVGIAAKDNIVQSFIENRLNSLTRGHEEVGEKLRRDYEDVTRDLLLAQEKARSESSRLDREVLRKYEQVLDKALELREKAIKKAEENVNYEKYRLDTDKRDRASIEKLIPDDEKQVLQAHQWAPLEKDPNGGFRTLEASSDMEDYSYDDVHFSFSYEDLKSGEAKNGLTKRIHELEERGAELDHKLDSFLGSLGRKSRLEKERRVVKKLHAYLKQAEGAVDKLADTFAERETVVVEREGEVEKAAQKLAYAEQRLQELKDMETNNVQG